MQVTDRGLNWLLAASCALGLAATTWVWLHAASMSADGAHYMELAAGFRNSGLDAAMDWYAGPGYPVAVAWLYGWLGDLEVAGRLTSLLFSLATFAALGLLSYRLFGRTVAVLAVSLLALHSTWVRHAVMAETDVAYGCWLVCSVWATWELRHAKRLGQRCFWGAAAAGALGFGYLTRPEAVPLAGLLALWYLFARGEHAVPLRVRLLNVSAIAAIFLVIAAPYLLKLRRDLGRWSLSGKERSIVLKFVPDKRNYEEVLKLGVSGALLQKPGNLVHWLPYHVRWGIPQLVKSLSPIVLVLAAVAVSLRELRRAKQSELRYLLWTSVPFVVFFFLTFPGRRYFMQTLPQCTMLAAAGAVELARGWAAWRARRPFFSMVDTPARSAARFQRAYRCALATPLALMLLATAWAIRRPIESSLATERAIGERILQAAGPGRRILGFTVTAFYARAERVPLWGPMEGIVRCHGYGQPLSYEALLDYCRRHRVDYIVMDHDLRADCPEFLEHRRDQDFELVSDDIVDHHGPHLVYRVLPLEPAMPNAN